MVSTTKMGSEEIKQTIELLLGQFAPEADFEALDPDEDVRRALDIDSFDFLNFLIGLNEQLGVDIPEADAGRLNSINDMVAYLQARV
jgi:acyl carrier protein